MGVLVFVRGVEALCLSERCSTIQALCPAVGSVMASAAWAVVPPCDSASAAAYMAISRLAVTSGAERVSRTAAQKPQTAAATGTKKRMILLLHNKDFEV